MPHTLPVNSYTHIPTLHTHFPNTRNPFLSVEVIYYLPHSNNRGALQRVRAHQPSPPSATLRATLQDTRTGLIPPPHATPTITTTIPPYLASPDPPSTRSSPETTSPAASLPCSFVGFEIRSIVLPVLRHLWPKPYYMNLSRAARSHFHPFVCSPSRSF